MVGGWVPETRKQRDFQARMDLSKNGGVTAEVKKREFPREKCDRYGFDPVKRCGFLLKRSQTMRIHAENTRIRSETTRKPPIAKDQAAVSWLLTSPPASWKKPHCFGVFTNTGVKMDVQPDVAVELTPEDWRNGIDTQLLEAVDVVATDVREWKVRKGSIVRAICSDPD